MKHIWSEQVFTQRLNLNKAKYIIFFINVFECKDIMENTSSINSKQFLVVCNRKCNILLETILIFLILTPAFVFLYQFFLLLLKLKWSRSSSLLHVDYICAQYSNLLIVGNFSNRLHAIGRFLSGKHSVSYVTNVMKRYSLYSYDAMLLMLNFRHMFFVDRSYLLQHFICNA